MLPNTFFLDPTLTQLCMVFHFLCLIDSIFYKGLKSIVPERYSRGTITRTIKIPDFGIKTRCYRNFLYYCFNRVSSCTVREGFHEMNGSILIIQLIVSFLKLSWISLWKLKIRILLFQIQMYYEKGQKTQIKRINQLKYISLRIVLSIQGKYRIHKRFRVAEAR